ncbi:NitT/TauT family transport system permease protein [Bradyrhizobium canariense]|uniref:NitT/TauT family transport system permease protein n=1 Tax=Bradyrhizobium canariense TaxID=255045 RepID=A0A1H1ULM6_9BRAD|nr:NitT/TauT family transport system permease protein [Bradyrhizobium canariense]
MLPRILSLAAMIAIWAVAAALAQSRLLPGPLAIGAATLAEIRSGELPFQMACTLGRVIGSFAIAMLLGTIAGYVMGRSKAVDRFADPWLIVLINMPALVIIIFAYIWIGLNETAAILAVAINKLPNVTAVMREGARALDPELDEMAEAFQFTWFSRIRHIVIPQLVPYLAASSRSGLSIVWKIVLVVELLGRPNGVGFVLGSAFSLFDMARILSYAICFIVLMLVIESFLVQPLERRANRWRRRSA